MGEKGFHPPVLQIAEIPAVAKVEDHRRRDKRPAVDEVDSRPTRRPRDGTSRSVPPVAAVSTAIVPALLSNEGVSSLASTSMVPTAPVTSPPTRDSNSGSGSGTPHATPQGSRSASWIQPDFTMPSKRVELKKLGVEIASSAVPLRNLEFTHPTAASFIGFPAITRAIDMRLYEQVKEMGWDESSNRAGALLVQVRVL